MGVLTLQWHTPAHRDTLTVMIRPKTAAVAVPRRADTPEAFRAFRRRRTLRGSLSPSVVDALASAIQTHEGYYPGSLAYTNNNPGNLTYVGQAGASLGSGGFARFGSYSQGLQALKDQLTLDATRGTDAAGRPIATLSDLIGSWAPASDPRNDTPAYIDAVARDTGFDPNAPLAQLGDGVVPVFSVDVFGSGIDGSQFGDGGSAATSGGSLDLAAIVNSTVDLSAIGLPSFPWWWLIAGGVGLFALSRR